jgi:hypothetical protein
VRSAEVRRGEYAVACSGAGTVCGVRAPAPIEDAGALVLMIFVGLRGGVVGVRVSVREGTET